MPVEETVMQTVNLLLAVQFQGGLKDRSLPVSVAYNTYKVACSFIYDKLNYGGKKGYKIAMN